MLEWKMSQNETSGIRANLLVSLKEPVLFRATQPPKLASDKVGKVVSKRWPKALVQATKNFMLDVIRKLGDHLAAPAPMSSGKIPVSLVVSQKLIISRFNSFLGSGLLVFQLVGEKRQPVSFLLKSPSGGSQASLCNAAKSRAMCQSVATLHRARSFSNLELAEMQCFEQKT